MEVTQWLAWVSATVIILGLILTAVEHYDRKNR